MDLQQLVKLWQQGRAAIRMGLFCSFLTCLAGALLNAFLDGQFYAFDPAGLMRRLIVGYAGSATVVVLAFPFLSRDQHQQRPDDST
jgi:uncharacterized membrane protein YeaQ/YmgE (transglycosylase-associated protein family)